MSINPLAKVTFASDNYAGVHEAVFDAMLLANNGHAASYGGDRWTEQLQDVAKEHFGSEASIYPVFNGTAANVISLAAITPRYGAVIATAESHINNDEAGAPEKMAGMKILTAASDHAKLTADGLDHVMANKDFVHAARPSALSLSQATEMGTLYTPAELAELCQRAHSHDLVVHMDGSRLANASAALGISLGDLTSAVGVDILSLGGTKIGAMGAEAVVVLNPELNANAQIPSPVEYIRKYMMNLASKMRFVSAQMLELFGSDLYLRNARQANTMAKRLAEGVENIDGIDIMMPVEANAVFAKLPSGVADVLRTEFSFYDWDSEGTVRWMCSFDTSSNDVDQFIERIRSACLSHGAIAAD